MRSEVPQKQKALEKAATKCKLLLGSGCSAAESYLPGVLQVIPQILKRALSGDRVLRGEANTCKPVI